jgi:hypothetical protein
MMFSYKNIEIVLKTKILLSALTLKIYGQPKTVKTKKVLCAIVTLTKLDDLKCEISH